MSLHLSKSVHVAASLPLSELQKMSRGDLMQASNILHAGWSHARQQAETAKVREGVAVKDAADARREAVASVEAVTRELHALHRKFALLETQHNALQREHMRHETLLHVVDKEIASQASNLWSNVRHRVGGSDTAQSSSNRLTTGESIPNYTSDDEGGDDDGDLEVTIGAGALDDLLGTIKSCKFRIADLEDQLTLAKGDGVKLERALRSRKSVDVEVLEGTVALLQATVDKKHNENLSTKEQLIRSESQLATLRDEFQELQTRFEKCEEGESIDAPGSLLSNVSWSTATPGHTSRRRATRSYHNNDPLSVRHHQDPAGIADDAFGPSFSTTSGTQTESLVLQNVELLYKLQRDLLDLQVQRTALADDANRQKEENHRLVQRIELLERELEGKESQLVDAMEQARSRASLSAMMRDGRRTVAQLSPTPEAAVGSVMQLQDRIAQNEEAAARAANVAAATIASLQQSAEAQRNELTRLQEQNEHQATRLDQLQRELDKGTEREGHLTEEVRRLMQTATDLAEDNARLQALSEMDGGEFDNMLQKEVSLHVAEGRIGALESELSVAQASAQRATALEDELRILQTQLERQRNVVLRTMSERDEALQECRELAEMLGATSSQAQPQLPSAGAVNPQEEKAILRYVASAIATMATAATDAVSHTMHMATLSIDATSESFGAQMKTAMAVHRRSLLGERLERDIVAREQHASHGSSNARATAYDPRGAANPTDAARSHPLTLTQLAAHGDDHGPVSPTGPTLRDLESYAHSPTDDGVPLLGLDIVEVEGALVIDGVVKGSPAYNAGLKETDCVLSVDGVVVNSLDEFAAATAGKFQCTFSIVAGGGKRLAQLGCLSDDMLNDLEDVLVDLHG